MLCQLPENVIRTLKDLEYEVCRDSYNLTRDDHDAILVKIQQLKGFIEERYIQRAQSIKATIASYS